MQYTTQAHKRLLKTEYVNIESVACAAHVSQTQYGISHCKHVKQWIFCHWLKRYLVSIFRHFKYNSQRITATLNNVANIPIIIEIKILRFVRCKLKIFTMIFLRFKAHVQQFRCNILFSLKRCWLTHYDYFM